MYKCVCNLVNLSNNLNVFSIENSSELKKFMHDVEIFVDSLNPYVCDFSHSKNKLNPKLIVKIKAIYPTTNVSYDTGSFNLIVRSEMNRILTNLTGCNICTDKLVSFIIDRSFRHWYTLGTQFFSKVDNFRNEVLKSEKYKLECEKYATEILGSEFRSIIKALSPFVNSSIINEVMNQISCELIMEK